MIKNKFSVCYLLILFTIFSVFLGFNVSSVSAEDSCAYGSTYSNITGQLCLPGIYGECKVGDLFNVSTGKPCPNTTQNSQDTSASDVAQFNAVFQSWFKVGVKSNEVKPLQQFLKDQGYYFGKVDGKYGRITARAVKDFQEDNDISTSTPTQPTTSDNTPVISGVEGPQTLDLGQEGTWKITAITGIYGYSYSVIWGDENLYPHTTSPVSIDARMYDQSATFTHTYSTGGTFTPIFTVTNKAGQSTKTSLTVNVKVVSPIPVAPSLSISLDPSTDIPSSVIVGTPGVSIGSFSVSAKNSSAKIQFMGFKLTSFPNCPGMNFKLYAEGVQIGSTVTYADSGCGINFNNLSYVIAQYSTTRFYVKADLTSFTTPLNFALEMTGISTASDTSYDGLPITAKSINIVAVPTIQNNNPLPIPTIAYMQNIGCTTNIGTGSGLCSSAVPGGTTYVFGSNFDTNSKILFYIGNSTQLIPINLISSTSLSFIVPVNISSGAYNIEVYKTIGSNSYQSNTMNLNVVSVNSTLSVVLDTARSTAPQTASVGVDGASNLSRVSYKTTLSGNTSAVITELKFTVSPANSVTIISVGGVSAVVNMNNGVAYITGLNIPISNNISSNVDAYISYPGVGVNGIPSGTSSYVTLEYIKYTSVGRTYTVCTTSFGSCTYVMPLGVSSPAIKLIAQNLISYPVGCSSDQGFSLVTGNSCGTTNTQQQVVQPAAQPLTINISNFKQDLKIGQYYTNTLSILGGPAGLLSSYYYVSVSSGVLPPGLSLVYSGTDWVIKGVPVIASNYSFTINAVYGDQFGNKDFNLIVTP